MHQPGCPWSAKFGSSTKILKMSWPAPSACSAAWTKSPMRRPATLDGLFLSPRKFIRFRKFFLLTGFYWLILILVICSAVYRWAICCTTAATAASQIIWAPPLWAGTEQIAPSYTVTVLAWLITDTNFCLFLLGHREGVGCKGAGSLVSFSASPMKCINTVMNIVCNWILLQYTSPYHTAIPHFILSLIAPFKWSQTRTETITALERFN